MNTAHLFMMLAGHKIFTCAWTREAQEKSLTKDQHGFWRGLSSHIKTTDIEGGFSLRQWKEHLPVPSWRDECRTFQEGLGKWDLYHGKDNPLDKDLKASFGKKKKSFFLLMRLFLTLGCITMRTVIIVFRVREKKQHATDLGKENWKEQRNMLEREMDHFQS